MNLFEDLPNNLDEEVFEDLLTHKNLRIERIVSTGQTSPDVHHWAVHSLPLCVTTSPWL